MYCGGRVGGNLPTTVRSVQPTDAMNRGAPKEHQGTSHEESEQYVHTEHVRRNGSHQFAVHTQAGHHGRRTQSRLCALRARYRRMLHTCFDVQTPGRLQSPESRRVPRLPCAEIRTGSRYSSQSTRSGNEASQRSALRCDTFA